MSADKERTALLEKVFGVPARLKIMSALIGRASMDFPALIDLLGLTRGNLSMHMKTLSEHGYISVSKGYKGNKPQTLYTLTAAGKEDFKTYISMLESLISSIKKGDHQ